MKKGATSDLEGNLTIRVHRIGYKSEYKLLHPDAGSNTELKALGVMTVQLL